MITKIIKRDGREANFDTEKITQAIYKAAQAIGGNDYDAAKALSVQVRDLLEKKCGDKAPTVEQVQDAVEKVLIENGHARTAKEYILLNQLKITMLSVRTQTLTVILQWVQCSSTVQRAQNSSMKCTFSTLSILRLIVTVIFIFTILISLHLPQLVARLTL